MSSVRIILWCLPEVMGLLYVFLGPQITRWFFKGIIERASLRLSMAYDEAYALVTYYLDIHLAVVALVLLPYGVTRFIAFRLKMGGQEGALLGGWLFALVYFIILLCLLYTLFTKTNVQDYKKTTEEKINVLGLKNAKWGRVSGASGKMVWWCRVVPALVGVAFSVVAAFSIVR